MRVAGSGPDADSIVAFRIEAGATVFSGRLVDSFTQQPLANARLIVDGTAIEAETDAEGRFRIEGVPPGAQRVVIARNDYDVGTLDLVFEANKDVALDEDVALHALARPFQPGGSLPRSTSLASVLDRGVAGGTESLTQEQAEALIEDTLIAVGGNLVGVFDESGAQLNPQLEGVGYLSFTRAGIAAQARAMLQGQHLTLREIGSVLSTAFDWGGAPPDGPALAGMLQRFANDAWAHPENPLNAMAFVLLNDGTSLLPRAPTVTPDTQLNRFQASLLITAILIPSVHHLERQADERLREIGIDPGTIGARVPEPPRSFAAAAGERVSRALDLLVPAAHAQGSGEVILGPNTSVEADTFAGQTYTRMTKYAWRSFSADLVVGNLINAGIQTAIKAGIALAIGSTGGIAGTTLAVGFVASLAEGAGMSLLEKLALGYVIAAAADSLEPAPPLPQRSFVDVRNDKLVIEFARSASDVPGAQPTGPTGPDDPATTLRQYSYDLFEFKTPNSTDLRDALEIDAATVSESQRDPTKLQFAIPLGLVTPGVHYYRIATIQYLSAVALPLDEAKQKFSYRMLPSAGDDVPSIIKDVVSPVADWTNYVKGQYHISDFEKDFVKQGVDADLIAKYKSTTDPFAGLAREHEVEIQTLVKEKAALEEQILRDEDAVTNGITRAETLSRYADKQARNPGFDPAAFRDPSSDSAGRITEALDHYSTGDSYRAEVGARMAEIAESRQLAIQYEARASVHSDGITQLERLKADIQSGAVDPTNHGRTVDTYDVVDGRRSQVDLALPADRNAAVAQLDSAIQLEGEKLDLANRTVHDAEVDIENVADRFKRQEAPGIVDREADLAKKIAAGEELELRTQTAKTARDVKLQKSRKFAADADGFRRERIVDFEAVKPKTRVMLGTLNVIGAVAQVAGEINDIYEGTKLIYSDFSPPFRYTHTIRNIPRYSVEVDPNINMPDSIVIGRKGEFFVDENGQQQDQSKDGWLRTTFFDSGENETEQSAGFPPEFLSVDDEGRIYAHNGNSATRYGGRLFRFDTAHGLAREFIGSINYYSTLIQYGKPASPVAMTTGRVYGTSGPVEALLVADVEQVGTAGVSLPQPIPTIKQLPIDLLDEGQPYHDPATRNHFVGQPFVDDPRFRFTGPTDMVSASDGSFLRLYLSDEDTIFVVKQDLGSGATEVIPILSVSGAQWSGLALDDAPQPNFYFADYRSGFVYWVKHEDLLTAEQPGFSLLAFAKPIAALQDENGASIQPYDIDVHQGQRKLVGTSARGVFSMQLPVLRKAEATDPVLYIKRLGREYRGRLLQALNGDVYRVLPTSKLEQDYALAHVVARSSSSDPAGETTVEYDLSLPPAGPAEVEFAP